MIIISCHLRNLLENLNDDVGDTMNILLYSLIYPPDVCSNAYVFSDLTAELIRRGHQVTVITTTPHYGGSPDGLRNGKRKWYQYSSHFGASVYHICVASQKGNTRQRIKTFRKFHKYALKVVKEESIAADVVITQTPPPITVAFTVKKLCRYLNSKSILVMQDIWVDDIYNRGRIGVFAYAILKSIEKFAYNKIDAVATLTDGMLLMLKSRVSRDTELTVIPNPVNTSLYNRRERTAELLKRYQLEEDAFVVSYVGNIGVAQDLQPLIDYAKAYPNIRVLIAGNGSKESELRQAISGVSNITFLGYISREQTVEVNALSDVCLVMLSEYVSETCFPSKIPTIMATGKPIVLSCGSKCGVKEYIEDNHIGIVTSISDKTSFINAIDCFRENTDFKNKCGENAYYAAIRDFSLSSIGDRYEALFRQICCE